MPASATAKRRLLLLAGASGLAGPALGLKVGAAARSYPTRPLTFICPWPVGGTADQTMRVLANLLAQELEQPVQFQTIAGMSGMLGAHALASANPDGYTIGQLPLLAYRMAQLDMVTFDPLRDFTYLARTSSQTYGIVVRADSPFASLRELAAAAKAHPGKYSYASAGIATESHVGMARFLQLAGLKMRHIPYKGGAPALRDLQAGQVDVQCDSSSWASGVERGRLRLLATLGAQRLAALPSVPTLKEAGYDVVVDAPNGVAAPAGLEPHVVAVLSQALKKAVFSPAFVQACRRLHTSVSYQDSDSFRRFVEARVPEQKRLIETLKLKQQLARM